MRKFEQISEDLLDKIKNNTYSAGTLLPSEHQLCEIYNVSRETIRRALNVLREAGVIHKQQGYGSIVLDVNPNAMPVSGLVSYKELSTIHNNTPTTRVLKNEIETVPDFIVQHISNVAPDERMIHLIRARQINGETVIIDEDYLRQSIIPEVPSARAADSLYDYLENNLRLEIAYGLKEFRAQQPAPYISEAMNLTTEDYVIAVKSYVYLKDTRFFQYTVSYHNIDHFSFQEFALRRHIL